MYMIISAIFLIGRALSNSDALAASLNPAFFSGQEVRVDGQPELTQGRIRDPQFEHTLLPVLFAGRGTGNREHIKSLAVADLANHDIMRFRF